MSSIDKRCACKEYFNDLGAVGFSLSLVSVNPSTSYEFSSALPFLPIAILVPTNNNQVDFTNSKNFPDYFSHIMNDVLQASYNFLAASIADPSYLSGDYGVYLSQRIGVRSDIYRQNRFSEIGNMIGQFWRNYTVLPDYADNLTKLSTLIDQLQKYTDKKSWLAPGDYHVSAPNQTDTDTTAILTANPTWTLVNVLIIELQSIA